MQAEGVLVRTCFVLDVLAHDMTGARSPPGVEARQLVHAAHLETSVSVHTGAGVDVSSKPWLRDNDLDAQERAATQWWTP